MQILTVTVGAEREETAIDFMQALENAVDKVFDDWQGPEVMLVVTPGHKQHVDSGEPRG